MERINSLKRWQLLISGLIGLLLAYLLGSLAFDSGSWWHYFGTLVLLIVGIRLFARGVKPKK